MSLEISDIPILQRSNVKMKNLASVLTKINKIVSGESKQLQIISDYDFTLTKQHFDGELGLSSFGLISKWEGLPPDFSERDNEIKAKYQAIELDLHMPLEEKIPYMVEWYGIVEQNWKGRAFKIEGLRKLIKERKPPLRDGTVELCKLLYRHKIPMLVLSAGLGNVLLEVLRYHGVEENEYFHVMSNFFNLKGDIVEGYGCREEGTYIHPFNKNGSGCRDYFKKIDNSRPNLILMGDTLADAAMDRGVPSITCVLKIGFLYDHTPEIMEKRLSKYLDTFDIVLMDDQTMDVLRAIIDLVIKS